MEIDRAAAKILNLKLQFWLIEVRETLIARYFRASLGPSSQNRNREEPERARIGDRSERIDYLILLAFPA